MVGDWRQRRQKDANGSAIYLQEALEGVSRFDPASPGRNDSNRDNERTGRAKTPDFT